MQVFRLVQAGVVDKVIAFDELPKDLIQGINQREPSGLPRHWKEFAPFFFILDYVGTNNDKERWAKISSYVRRTVDTSFRILDRLEDMAKPMAPNSKDALDLEPEDVVVIPLQSTPRAEEPGQIEKPRRKLAGKGA